MQHLKIFLRFPSYLGAKVRYPLLLLSAPSKHLSTLCLSFVYNKTYIFTWTASLIPVILDTVVVTADVGAVVGVAEIKI